MATDPLVVPVVMTLTKADLGLAKSKDAPFTSHPDPDLLKFHPLEKFGCSPCHGGNGRALDYGGEGPRPLRALALAALLPGELRRRLPAVPRRRTCVTEHAPVLNAAKQLYREKGCIGCHKFQGFDNQDELLVADAPADSAARQRQAKPTSSKSRA